MFDRSKLDPIAVSGLNKIFGYKTDDTSLDIQAPGYFDNGADLLTPGSMILAQTKYGSLSIYVQQIVNGVVDISTGTRPTLEGSVANNNTITVAEIETILTAYGIETPLAASTAIYIQDPTNTQDKAYLCKYDESNSTWYFEKLLPCPVAQGDVGAQQYDSLQGFVANPQNITRAEIETTLTDAGFSLPSGKYNITIYINDIGSLDKMYQCRYDKTQDEWYQEQLKKA